MIKKKCDMCIKGIIMKQIAIAEYVAEPCVCMVKHEERRNTEWFKMLKRST